jgi:hypothetical protein
MTPKCACSIPAGHRSRCAPLRSWAVLADRTRLAGQIALGIEVIDAIVADAVELCVSVGVIAMRAMDAVNGDRRSA